jgi:hypothetical protein
MNHLHEFLKITSHEEVTKNLQIRIQNTRTITVLRIQYPGSGSFLDPGIRIRNPGWEKKLDPGSGSEMNIPDHFSESLEIVFRVKNT